MVPDCQRRLAKAFDELKILLETETAVSESEEYISAKKILEEAEAELLNPAAF
jgi:tubulin-specific chaperone A